MVNNSFNSSYSIPKTNSLNNTEDGDYCRYCSITFKKFNVLVNNICQSCGRVTQNTLKDKQPEETLTSINDPTLIPTSLKCVSQEMDYNPLFNNDETTQGINKGNLHMQAKDIDEAVKLLYITDSSARSMSMQNHTKYRINIVKKSKDIFMETDKKL